MNKESIECGCKWCYKFKSIKLIECNELND